MESKKNTYKERLYVTRFEDLKNAILTGIKDESILEGFITPLEPNRRESFPAYIAESYGSVLVSESKQLIEAHPLSEQ